MGSVAKYSGGSMGKSLFFYIFLFLIIGSGYWSIQNAFCVSAADIEQQARDAGVSEEDIQAAKDQYANGDSEQGAQGNSAPTGKGVRRDVSNPSKSKEDETKDGSCKSELAGLSCSGRKVPQNAAMLSTLSQFAGFLAVSNKGNQEAQKAAQQGNTQKAQLLSAAQDHESAAKQHTLSGMVNAAGFAWQMMEKTKASKNESTLRNARKDADEEAKSGTVNAMADDPGTSNGQDAFIPGKSDVGKNIIENTNANDKYVVGAGSVDGGAQRMTDFQTKQGALSGDISRIAGQGAAEQAQIKEENEQGSFKSFIQGAKDLANAYFEKQAAKDLRDAAANLSDPTSASDPDVIQVDPVGPGADSPRSNTWTPNTNTAATIPAESTETGDDIKGDLGQGFNPDGNPDKLAEGLKPDTAVPGGRGGGSGGGGGFMGGGGTSAAKDAPEGSPQYAGLGNDNTSYASGGGAYSGGGRKTDGENQGPNLTDLLGKLLPDKKDLKDKKDILAFGKELDGRNPSSLLGPDENLFQRIHQAYQVKSKAGAFGI